MVNQLNRWGSESFPRSAAELGTDPRLALTIRRRTEEEIPWPTPDRRTYRLISNVGTQRRIGRGQHAHESGEER